MAVITGFSASSRGVLSASPATTTLRNAAALRRMPARPVKGLVRVLVEIAAIRSEYYSFLFFSVSSLGAPPGVCSMSASYILPHDTMVVAGAGARPVWRRQEVAAAAAAAALPA
jgi:hypothetical protein